MLEGGVLSTSIFFFIKRETTHTHTGIDLCVPWNFFIKDLLNPTLIQKKILEVHHDSLSPHINMRDTYFLSLYDPPVAAACFFIKKSNARIGSYFGGFSGD